MFSRDFLLQLTSELYRLTLLFPKKEPLRYKMREAADDILADFLRTTNQYEFVNRQGEKHSRHIEPGQILDGLEVLDGFFEVAKSQKWVAEEELLKVQDEYSKLKGELKSQTVVLVDTAPQAVAPLLPRQQRILELLGEKGRAQVWEIKQVFPQVSKRTLRRDFENLLKQGLVQRIGERNTTFYQPVVGQDRTLSS